MATSDRISTLPREPSAYRPSVHFGARFHDRYLEDRPPRHLDDEIVRRCIEEGTVRTPPGTSRALFRETFGGVAYRLVVDLEEREVVSGYPVEIDVDKARASGRWSSEQIADIREFIRTNPSENVDGEKYCH